MTKDYRFIADPTAIIEEGAEIGEGTVIGPFSIIRGGVKIGKNNVIASNVTIAGETVIGDGNKFFSYSMIGSTPQILNWEGGRSQIVIGDYNDFREYVSIQPGVEQAGGVTKIGNHNHFMMYAHVGHDCIIGDYNRLTNAVSLAGHVQLANHVIIGGLSGVHQFVSIGDYSFINGMTAVSKDVPPFCMAQGNLASLVQINSVGLDRAGFSKTDINLLKSIFRKLFFEPGVLKEKVVSLKAKYADFEHGQSLFHFIENSERGVCGYSRKITKSEDLAAKAS